VSSSNRPCEFHKRSQLFIGAHNVTAELGIRGSRTITGESTATFFWFCDLCSTCYKIDSE
jgi:hypothetical protein